MKYWIMYRIIIRKLYKKRYRDRAEQTWSVSWMFMIFNILSIFFIFEILINIKGITSIIASDSIPWAPVAMLIAALIYVVYLSFFQRKLDKKKIRTIRKAYDKTASVSRRAVVIYVITSIALFTGSLILGISKIAV